MPRSIRLAPSKFSSYQKLSQALDGNAFADAISRILSGGAPDPAPVTNSACYSTITMTQASWLTAVFQYDAATSAMKGVAAASGASTGWDQDSFEEMGTWFKSLMGDSFA